MEQKFLDLFKETLEIEDREISLNDSFRDFDEWDSLALLSVIAMMMTTVTGRSPVIDFDFDVIEAITYLGLTPFQLGDGWVFEGKQSRDNSPFDPHFNLPYIPETLPKPERPGAPALVVNGVPNYSQAEKKKYDYFNGLAKLQYIFYLADRKSDVNTLLANPESREILKNWGTISVLPSWPHMTEKTRVWEMEPTNLKLKAGRIPITSQDWFDPKYAVSGQADNDQNYNKYIRENYSVDLSDYWKCLQTLQTIEKANLFSDPQNKKMLTSFGDIDAITSLFQDTYNFVIYKMTLSTFFS